MENFKKELKELLTKYNASLNVWIEDGVIEGFEACIEGESLMLNKYGSSLDAEDISINEEELLEEYTIYSSWCVDDVLQQAEEDGVTLTSQQCKEVLDLVSESHDATVGINWDVISEGINQIINNY